MKMEKIIGSDQDHHQAKEPSYSSANEASIPSVLINASGHRQELDRNFRLINIVGLGVTSGNTWIALGGSIVSSLFT